MNKKYIPYFIFNWRTKISHGVKLLFLKKKKGKSTYIDKSAHITGWKSIEIGNYSVISEGTWINVNRRIPDFVHIKIGNNCYIGKKNLLSSGKQIVIGDYFMSGSDCKLLCADHIFNDPCKPYIATGVTDDKSIIIGANVRLGAGVIVIGEVTIGYGSVIGAGTLANKSIPPFSVVIGNPCRVIKRYSFALKKWIKQNEYSSENDLELPDETSYLNELKKTYPKLYIPLQAASRKYGNML
jgi:acetyltransferase-like isoleucine patch superfamily enzyme